jgi:hypothetical protein
MSGIVGGAGSKSGVIGETTMRYEEGSWTPTFNVTVSGGTTIGYYVRKGNEVTIYVQWSGTYSGSISSIRSLPFNLDHSTAGYSIGMTFNNSRGTNGATRFDDTEYLFTGSIPQVSGDLVMATGSYITDSP